MANTYSQLYIHLVFSVKNRLSLLNPESFRVEMFRHLATDINSRGNHVIVIGGVEDHVHILFGLNPAESLSKLVQAIKKNSTNWVVSRTNGRSKFAWQRGYGAFSYSYSQIERVREYILRQPEHHTRVSFKDEYLGILQNFHVDYDERYVTDL